MVGQTRVSGEMCFAYGVLGQRRASSRTYLSTASSCAVVLGQRMVHPQVVVDGGKGELLHSIWCTEQ